jgi:23S rRNA (pseudouridine1915-N3)-methyltransferase
LRISLICVGRLGRSPEADLANGYVVRAAAVGRSLGLAPIEIVEVESRQPGSRQSQALLAKAQGTWLIACDERGLGMSSRAFAEHVGALRDQGVRHLAFALGGADGLDEAVRDLASETLAFGPQTWPHALVRVMLAEQIYRAASLLAGAPYHRD